MYNNGSMAQRMVDELTNDVHELDEEKTKFALCKFWEHDKPSRCLARFVKEMRNT
jgi:hypothetical protein